jgi:transposase
VKPSGIFPTVCRRNFSRPCSKPAREAEAGLGRIILLVLDNAGWHSAAGLKIPDGIRLVHLPPYSPELQPAETLWALVDEPIVNKHIATIADLEEKIANQCIALAAACAATRAWRFPPSGPPRGRRD